MLFKTKHFFHEIDFKNCNFFKVFNSARENILLTKLRIRENISFNTAREKILFNKARKDRENILRYLNTVDTSSLSHLHVILSLVDVQGFLEKKQKFKNRISNKILQVKTIFHFIHVNWIEWAVREPIESTRYRYQ